MGSREGDPGLDPGPSGDLNSMSCLAQQQLAQIANHGQSSSNTGLGTHNNRLKRPDEQATNFEQLQHAKLR